MISKNKNLQRKYGLYHCIQNRKLFSMLSSNEMIRIKKTTFKLYTCIFKIAKNNKQAISHSFCFKCNFTVSQLFIVPALSSISQERLFVNTFFNFYQKNRTCFRNKCLLFSFDYDMINIIKFRERRARRNPCIISVKIPFDAFIIIF